MILQLFTATLSRKTCNKGINFDIEAVVYPGHTIHYNIRKYGPFSNFGTDVCIKGGGHICFTKFKKEVTLTLLNRARFLSQYLLLTRGVGN